MSDVATPTPTPTPTPAAAASPAMPPQVAPDLSQVAPTASVIPDAEAAFRQKGIEQSAAGMQQASKNIQDLSAPAPNPATMPPGKARLFAMIQGLGIGLSSFGTAMGTHGKEGGAPEVQQFYANQQAQKLQAQQAAQTQRNQQIQNQITSFDTNQKMGQTWYMLGSMPLELEQHHVDLELSQQKLATGATDAQIQIGEFMKQNWGLSPAQVAGSSPTTGADLSNSKSMLDRSVNGPTGAIQILGKDNPAVVAAQKVAANPSPSVSDIMSAGQGLSIALSQHKAVLDSKKEQADTETAETNAQYAGPKAQADIAKSRAQAASAFGSEAKNAFELGQEKREAASIQTPDATGFVSPLTTKTYDARYGKFTGSKDYQTLSTLKGSYQQFNDTLNHIAQTGEMTGAESVVGLFNAIGISATPLAGKGFRVNQNVINEHAEARGIDQAAYQKLLSLKAGDVITPKQLSDYSNIAAGVYHNAYVNAADEAHRQGLPVDFLPQGGGKTLDPVSAQIYTDVVLHSNPNLARDPKALKAAIVQAAGVNGWKLQ